jgi:uncharacterized protein (DUF111 family)
MTVEATGTGAGTRDAPDRANVFRIVVGESDAATRAAEPASQAILVLECQVDDMAPQLLAPLFDRLHEKGALDAYFTPIHMKKGRPGILISVLAEPSRRETLEEVLFRETTTLGVRRHEWQRTALERESVAVDTPYGPVRVKLGKRHGRVYNAQPEFEDCSEAARRSGAPLKEVWAAALAAYRARP